MEELMLELQPLIINAVITIVGAVATYVGVRLKSIFEEKVNTEQKKKIVETTCRYVNQLYKDLEGPAKFQKAKDVILQQLDAKGIIITELELDVLIESTVNSFKDGYNGTTTLLEVKTPEEVEQIEEDNELVG